MAMNLKPLGDRVVIEPIEQEGMTASGLVLPETAKEKPQRGKIVAAGPGARDKAGQRVALEVVVGDTILYAKYAGTEFKTGSQTLLILRESDLLAKLEAGEAPKKK